MIMNSEPYPISFEREMSQALVCRYGEEMRQYVFKPDIDVSGLSCLLQIAKTDGTFTENGVEVHTDPETGECTLVITIPQQATVVKGLNRYSICCYGEVETEMHLLYSAEGPLWVDDNLITDDMIQSVAEVNGLVFPQDFLTVENLVDIVNYVVAEIIKDDTTSDSTTWSSQKITDEIAGHTSPMSLDDLTDVVITSPAAGDDLQYDGEKWINAPLPDPSVTKTATGNPIEITDAAAAPIVKCVTEIQGSQDLHGYDKPWVGGAGKNKLPDYQNLTHGIGLPNEIYSTSASGYGCIIPVLPNTIYTLSGNISASNADGVIRFGEFANYPEVGVSCSNYRSRGANFTFTTNATTNYIVIWFTSPVSGYQVMFAQETTASTFAPYSNICPITAYSSGTIEVEDGDGNTTTHTTTYPSAIYRGSEDCVVGEVVTEWGMIASYAGETLPGEWISDRDEYVPGTTPTTGAQVAYALATPTTSPVTVSNLPIRTLSGYNHIESSTGELEIEYLTQTYEPIAELIDRSSHHVYSTEEKVIGKWIDGKDIYEITLEINSFSASSYDNNWYYGTVDLSTYGITPEHVFPDCAASYITLGDTTTRTPVYIDWQGGSNVYPYFIGSRTGNLTLTLRYTKQ